MIAESQKNSAAAKAMAKPLKRGKACLNCRFLKIKCDAAKPTCGPCRKHPKEEDCEYADGPGRSRTKALEEHVSRLEARINELEHPDETTPSVILHDPYSPYHESIAKASPALFIPESRSVDPLSPFSSTSTSSSSNRQWISFGALEPKAESVGSSGSSSSPQRHITSSPFLGTEVRDNPAIIYIARNDITEQEPGFITIQTLFRETALLPLSFGHPSRPSPAVLSAVYLWGVHFSQSEALLQEEHAFLVRALQRAATDTLGSHPDAILHTLQAEVLLSYYLLRSGRFIEAKCHAATAVSLALGAGLHKTRSSNLVAAATLGLSTEIPTTLPPPRDSVAEGERINGFWAVLSLHKYIMIALEHPLSICGTLEALGIQVDTPWPLDTVNYAEGALRPHIRGNNTIRSFLLNMGDGEHFGHSLTALNVKAAVLFHRSAQLAAQWHPAMQPRDFQAYTGAFQSLHRLTETFRSTLPPLSNDIQQPSTRTLLLIHALTDAATIKLHINFSYAAEHSSKHYCLTAARRMVTFGINIQDVGHVNPIMGTLWTAACHVFIDEISRVRAMGTTLPANAEGSEDELMERLRSGMSALSARSDESPFTRYQLTKVQEAFSAI
ncbi:hypothetical protein H0H92_001010 [Tricholoma furcatifolium]|nr:hypothetical protein H0H92_001010 [Tricholoma furcatifolium]